MASANERASMNKLLGKAGLGQLDDPGLASQLGFLVKDHDHFRQMLNRCEPVERRNMYEALKPHLRFAAHPLDVYVAELGQRAEAEQLPTWNREQQKFEPYRVVDLRSQVQALIEDATAKQHLWLVCKRCTREEVFHGMTKNDAVQAARDAGWVYSALGEGVEICPTCPATRVAS